MDIYIYEMFCLYVKTLTKYNHVNLDSTVNRAQSQTGRFSAARHLRQLHSHTKTHV